MRRKHPRIGIDNVSVTSSWLAALVIMVAWLCLVVAAPAQADPYGIGGPEAGLRPDNGEHTYCYRATYVGSTPRQAAVRAMTDVLDALTTMFDTFMSNCNANSDALFEIRNTGTMADNDGRWTCRTVIQGNPRRCGSAVLAFNSNNVTSTSDWRQTTCHEVGHSVGLHHNAADCMGNQHNERWMRTWNQHHINHVNNDR